MKELAGRLGWCSEKFCPGIPFHFTHTIQRLYVHVVMEPECSDWHLYEVLQCNRIGQLGEGCFSLIKGDNKLVFSKGDAGSSVLLWEISQTNLLVIGTLTGGPVSHHLKTVSHRNDVTGWLIGKDSVARKGSIYRDKGILRDPRSSLYGHFILFSHIVPLAVWAKEQAQTQLCWLH